MNATPTTTTTTTTTTTPTTTTTMTSSITNASTVPASTVPASTVTSTVCGVTSVDTYIDMNIPENVDAIPTRYFGFHVVPPDPHKEGFMNSFHFESDRNHPWRYLGNLPQAPLNNFYKEVNTEGRVAEESPFKQGLNNDLNDINKNIRESLISRGERRRVERRERRNLRRGIASTEVVSTLGMNEAGTSVSSSVASSVPDEAGTSPVVPLVRLIEETKMYSFPRTSLTTLCPYRDDWKATKAYATKIPVEQDYDVKEYYPLFDKLPKVPDYHTFESRMPVPEYDVYPEVIETWDPKAKRMRRTVIDKPVYVRDRSKLNNESEHCLDAMGWGNKRTPDTETRSNLFCQIPLNIPFKPWCDSVKAQERYEYITFFKLGQEHTYVAHLLTERGLRKYVGVPIPTYIDRTIPIPQKEVVWERLGSFKIDEQVRHQMLMYVQDHWKYGSHWKGDGFNKVRGETTLGCVPSSLDKNGGYAYVKDVLKPFIEVMEKNYAYGTHDNFVSEWGTVYYTEKRSEEDCVSYKCLGDWDSFYLKEKGESVRLFPLIFVSRDGYEIVDEDERKALKYFVGSSLQAYFRYGYDAEWLLYYGGYQGFNTYMAEEFMPHVKEVLQVVQDLCMYAIEVIREKKTLIPVIVEYVPTNSKLGVRAKREKERLDYLATKEPTFDDYVREVKKLGKFIGKFIGKVSVSMGKFAWKTGKRMVKEEVSVWKYLFTGEEMKNEKE